MIGYNIWDILNSSYKINLCSVRRFLLSTTPESLDIPNDDRHSLFRDSKWFRSDNILFRKFGSKLSSDAFTIV